MPDREPQLPGVPSQPTVPATGGPPPASSRQAVQTGAVAVAALVFVVGGLAWAYHLIHQGDTQPAGTLQQTPPGSRSTTPSALQEPERSDDLLNSIAFRPENLLPGLVNQAIDRGVAHLRRDWCEPKEYRSYH